jgi:hypothetical protein
MSTLRGFLPQQDSSYSGKVEAATAKGSFDSVLRLILPTQKTTYVGKSQALEPTYTFFTNILANILEDVSNEVWDDDKCC